MQKLLIEIVTISALHGIERSSPSSPVASGKAKTDRAR